MSVTHILFVLVVLFIAEKCKHPGLQGKGGAEEEAEIAITKGKAHHVLKQIGRSRARRSSNLSSSARHSSKRPKLSGHPLLHDVRHWTHLLLPLQTWHRREPGTDLLVALLQMR
ncbi:hypothetical protein V5799_017453 [Amblyomma americanum]|uniref:Secreted protein n=1 Tax=Amblyomma americanum TaxID=6943 RepID=A0AAQ4F385_AMBAM